MKKLFVFTLLFNFVFAQNLQKPSDFEISQLPKWAKVMYSENPSMFEVEELFKDYYSEHLFQKDFHTQYYKRWKRKYANYLDQNGYIVWPSKEQQKQIDLSYQQKLLFQKSSNWSLVGPINNFQTQGQGSGQANVYCMDQSVSNPNVLFCGTEPGEVYKSTNGGNNWSSVSLNEDFGSGVTAIKIHPNQPDIVFAGGNNGIFRSTNGGQTWVNVSPDNNLGVNEILINSANNQLVFACTDKGLLKSENGGQTWSVEFNQKSYDIKENTADASVLYLVKNNPTLKICEFFVSNDSGNTWQIQSSGWYSSNDAARNDGGARIAVSPQNSQRIYAYLIGESKPNDFGFIGVYRSDDGGVTWTLPSGQVGGPYSATNINLAIGWPEWTYHQGFYNCAIMASPDDANEILVGGLNLYRSVDGGESFTSVAGYVGGPLDMHVDMQDFRNFGNTTWITTDGGIYRSTDFFTSNHDFKMSGLNGSDYWGFGSGWNDDVLVGGLYHNGNLAHFENYGEGNFLELGGGEAPTGYVNPGNNRKTYFSDIGGKLIPQNLNDPILNVPFGLSPNESYFAAESSELVFHPNCYSKAYMGKDNSLWETSDGGGTFNLVYTFGNNSNHQIKYIEISSKNPKVIYLTQQPSEGNLGKLWKSSDGGISWSSVTLPSGNSRRMLISLHPIDDKLLWIAFPDGANGSKVFRTSNAGISWENLTAPILNNESIQALVNIAGTDGGIYVATNRAVYYRNNSTSFQIDNGGLPLFTNGNILQPFYRDGKIRLATYGKGIWESNFNEQPIFPIARATVDKLNQVVVCEIDSFFFEDYSFLNHTNASWNWSFPTGSPSSSTLRNPAVFFNEAGTHTAILQITDGNGNSSSDTISVEVVFLNLATDISENFEGNFPPLGWTIDNPQNDGQWQQNQTIGAFGNSSKCAFFDNYNIYSEGNKDDLILNFNPSSIGSQPFLTFDVAYARWGAANSDTLEILASTDCGETYQSLYLKGGSDLATSPDFQDAFFPTSAQWRKDSVNLSAYLEVNNLQIAFRNIGRYGNNLFIDNVNIGQTATLSENEEISPILFPNPININGQLKMVHSEAFNVKIFDANGRSVYIGKGVNALNLPLNNRFSSGIYTVQIQGKNKIWNKKLVVN